MLPCIASHLTLPYLSAALCVSAQGPVDSSSKPSNPSLKPQSPRCLFAALDGDRNSRQPPSPLHSTSSFQPPRFRSAIDLPPPRVPAALPTVSLPRPAANSIAVLPGPAGSFPPSLRYDSPCQLGTRPLSPSAPFHDSRKTPIQPSNGWSPRSAIYHAIAIPA